MDRQVEAEKAVRGKAKLFYDHGKRLIDGFLADYKKTAQAEAEKNSNKLVANLDEIYVDAMKKLKEIKRPNIKELRADKRKEYEDVQKTYTDALAQVEAEIAACEAVISKTG